MYVRQHGSRLILHPSEREAHELPPVARAMDGERRLADPGWADEAEDRALGLAHELSHGQELEDPLLDLGQTVVVLVEHLLRPCNVTMLLAGFLPRHGQQPVEVVAGDRRLGRHRGHRLQTLELPQRLLLGFLGHAGGLDPSGELLELLLGVGAAQLLVDRLDLLRQVVLPLRFPRFLTRR